MAKNWSKQVMTSMFSEKTENSYFTNLEKRGQNVGHTLIVVVKIKTNLFLIEFSNKNWISPAPFPLPFEKYELLAFSRKKH